MTGNLTIMGGYDFLWIDFNLPLNSILFTLLDSGAHWYAKDKNVCSDAGYEIIHACVRLLYNNDSQNQTTTHT